MKTQLVAQQENTHLTTPAHTENGVTQLWHRVALAGILLVSAFLNFFDLQQVDYGNIYYSAAVKSMLENVHNFFFVSFDGVSLVSVDKPPLGLWIQAASAKVFGFSGLSLLLPEAVAGVLSVALLYVLVRHAFGPVAGLLAALILAVTPVSVATSRDNIVDGLLVLFVLVGAWMITRAVETGSLRWLLLCAAFLGLAFNIKTLQAYLVLPAFGLVYLLGAPLRWRTRIIHLAIALVVLLAVSFAWIVAVDLTPASQRPYVGSSSTNSELNLTFGYNGVQRVLGTIFGGGRAASGGSPSSQQQPAFPGGGANGPGGMGFPGGGAFSSSGLGAASPLRLFLQDMAGQISWLLPLTLVGLFAAAWQTWRKASTRLPGNQRQHALILWGGWLLTMVIYFSIAGAEHSYYLTMLGPGIAATSAIGIVALWGEYRRSGWTGWLLPITLIGTALVQVYILSAYASWSSWLTPLILTLSLVGAVALVIVRLFPRLSLPRVTYPAIVAGMLALLIAPTTWAAITTQQPGGLIPTAGPTSTQTVGGMGAFPQGIGALSSDLSRGDPTLEHYLIAHQGQSCILVATQSATQAAPIALDTGKTVIAWGGFLGTDPVLTTQKLASMVDSGEVHFFLTMSISPTDFNIDEIPPQIRKELPPQILRQMEAGDFEFGGFGGSNANSAITTWITKNCSQVPASDWQSPASSNQAGPGAMGAQLYDCSSHR